MELSTQEQETIRLIDFVKAKPKKYLKAFTVNEGLIYCVDPLRALKDCGVSVYANAEAAKMDIVPQRYEGGFKVWECELRAVEHLEASADLRERTRGARVAELGCGAGLIGVLSCKLGAAFVLFQDYNQDVLDHATRLNLQLNFADNEPSVELWATSWSDWEQRLRREPLDEQRRFDLVWGADILYETAHYPVLIDLLCRLLRREGRAVIVSKVFYFGNSGDLLEFKNVLARDARLELEQQIELRDAMGSSKEILLLKFAAASP